MAVWVDWTAVLKISWHSAEAGTGLGRRVRRRGKAVPQPGQQYGAKNTYMKVLTIPSSGKLANVVAYVSPFGVCQRTLVKPRNTHTAARDYMRGAFGNLARAWRGTLTEDQRGRWNLAGPKVMSYPRLGRGPLSGQQHFQGVNGARARIGLAPLLEPPAPVVLGPNPAGQLFITNGEEGVRLRLRVNGEVKEDIMVFGQAPCSAGRMKRRNVSYLGLLGPVVDGLSDITEMYRRRFGEPRAGEKVFIVTRQQEDGWEGVDQVTSEIVPEWEGEVGKVSRLSELYGLDGSTGVNGLSEVGVRAGKLAAADGLDQQVRAETGLTLQSKMDKGCSRDAAVREQRVKPRSLEAAKARTQGEKVREAVIGGREEGMGDGKGWLAERDMEDGTGG